MKKLYIILGIFIIFTAISVGMTIYRLAFRTIYVDEDKLLMIYKDGRYYSYIYGPVAFSKYDGKGYTYRIVNIIHP